jgi:hypothetical protein
MFPLGTFPSLDVLKIDLQPRNEPLFFSDQFTSCIFGCYPIVVPLSVHEVSTFMQAKSYRSCTSESHQVPKLLTLKFLLDASHRLSEMDFFQCFYSVNHYKKTLLEKEFDPTEYDVQ